MDAIYNLFSFDMAQALSWTLLHSLWQGLLIASILSILVKHAQSMSSRSKSWLSLAALSSLLIVSIITFFCYYDFASSEEQLATSVQGDWNTVASYLGSEQSETYASLTDYISEYSQYIVVAWMLGFVLFILHVILGLFQLNRIKRNLVPISQRWENKLAALTAKLHYTETIILGESKNIQSPITFGFLKPVILFPIGMINQLSTQEVEAIMAHELAHIVRKDYLVNFLQTLLEGIYYFNPGVWIISSIIRNQREHCCDDMAIALTGNSTHYLKAIIAIEETNSEKYLAMGFSNNKKPLLQRVQRILNQPQKNNSMKEKVMIFVMILTGSIVYSLYANTESQIPDLTTKYSDNVHEQPELDITSIVGNDTIPNTEKLQEIGNEKTELPEFILNQLRTGSLNHEDLNRSISSIMLDYLNRAIPEEQKKANEMYKFDTSITTEKGRVEKRLLVKRTELAEIKTKLNNQSEITDKEVNSLMEEALALYHQEMDLLKQSQQDFIATHQTEFQGREKKLQEEINRLNQQGSEILSEFEEMQKLLSDSQKEKSRTKGMIADLKNELKEIHRNESPNTSLSPMHTQTIVIAKLIEDGLLEDPDNFDFVLNNNGLTINSKTQSTKVYEQYRSSINERNTGTNLEITSYSIKAKDAVFLVKAMTEER